MGVVDPDAEEEKQIFNKTAEKAGQNLGEVAAEKGAKKVQQILRKRSSPARKEPTKGSRAAHEELPEDHHMTI